MRMRCYHLVRGDHSGKATPRSRCVTSACAVTRLAT